MKAVFVDTSSLFKLYYPEDDSDEVERFLLSCDRVMVSALTRVELASVVARKVRMRELDDEGFRALSSAFEQDWLRGAFRIIALTSDTLTQAVQLIERWGLRRESRTLDALQLASALSSGCDTFLCHDTRLKSLADACGMACVE